MSCGGPLPDTYMADLYGSVWPRPSIQIVVQLLSMTEQMMDAQQGLIAEIRRLQLENIPWDRIVITDDGIKVMP